MNDDSLYTRKLVQLHDRGIVGRMQQISGDPSADLPPSIDVASPVTPVFDIGNYQQKTLTLMRSGGNNVTSLNLVWNQEAEIGALRKARAFHISGLSYNFDNTTPLNTDYWTECYLTFDVPNGPAIIAVLNTFTEIAGPSHVHKIDGAPLMSSKVFDNHEMNWTGTFAGTLSPRLASVHLDFTQSNGTLDLRIQSVSVTVQLFY